MNLTLRREPGPNNLLAGCGAGQCTPVRIYHPWGFVETVQSGSKPERGEDGFEVLAAPGDYRVDVAGYRFDFEAEAGLTFLTFSEGEPEPPPGPEPPPEPEPPVWKDWEELLEVLGRVEAAARELGTVLKALNVLLGDLICTMRGDS